MKKTLMLSLLFMLTVVAQAQVKIAPEMAKGTKMVYDDVTTTELPTGTIEIKIETVYEVAEATTDGYVVNVTLTQVETTGGDKMTNLLMSSLQSMLKDVTVRVATDKDGCAKSVLNYEEVKQKSVDGVTKMIDALYEETPQIAAMMPKENIIGQILGEMTEETLVKSLTVNHPSALTLNGLTIQNMGQDTYTNSQNIKMNRMYFVADGGKTITTSSTAAMSADELKEYIIQQVEKTAPDQVEMVKQNLDALVSGGMMKVDAQEKVVYELLPNNWLKSATMNSDMTIMGQQLKTSSVITLKQ